ncbi:MAG: peptide chain release factor N(5)-glutamine methyltransferase [Gammaproteobacteria bacterium]|nr:peptide chain release factor N(5)-glutamine methyltransferase [Gammaproteobacteria bacterium]MDH5652414.1 peptide chain release factor N(5)-glutamine methyltransferase [Gammaproteobacteria bacterium]
MSLSIQQSLRSATDRLSTASDTARLDAEILLAHVLDTDRSRLFTWPEQILTPEQETSFLALIERRSRGEPVAYLVGDQDFWTLKLKVTTDTLIPRPETELLVEQALAHLAADQSCTVADLGVGSGAIALAIANERPLAQLIGIDQSPGALMVAEENAQQLGIRNVRFQQSDWLAGFPADCFDMIVANPPYIAAADPHLQQGDVRFEPVSALIAGADGLDDIRRIVQQAAVCLKPGGRLLMEHGYDQQQAVIDLLNKAGYHEVCGKRDLAGQPRMVMAQKPR